MGDMEEKIKLQVGERQFVTTRATLVGESAYFEALLSGRWNLSGEDGYFIDSDPTLFTEILRYLRSGNFPLYFDPGSGTYDYAKYAALLGEAQYFGIQKLENWIRKQSYLDAVKIHYSVNIIEDAESENLTVGADQRVDFSYLSRTKSVYQCPRGIYVHQGQPQKCGRQCENARGEAKPEYEDTQVLTAVVVKTKQVFNPEVCLGVHAESNKQLDDRWSLFK
ncbi:hypothetical protein F5Y12DRAFT_712960 [Xylaria sp. FL1777]|nr:hypothetical protein F5Y12DRAFT_712960 [Xylaria sp. FL1777]